MAKAKAAKKSPPKKAVRVEIMKLGKDAKAWKIISANRIEIAVSEARDVIAGNNLKQSNRIQSQNGTLYTYT